MIIKINWYFFAKFGSITLKRKQCLHLSVLE